MIIRVLSLLLTCFLFSCSLNYEEARIAEDISEKTPDTILFKFTHTVVKKGKPIYRISAARAENYSKKDLSYLFAVRFVEYDASGAVITEGKADYAEFHTDTENAELEGNIEFFSAEENSHVYGGYLSWDNEGKLLKGNPDGSILLSRDSGSEVEGIGFEADFKTLSIQFREGVTGKFVSDEED